MSRRAGCSTPGGCRRVGRRLVVLPLVALLLTGCPAPTLDSKNPRQRASAVAALADQEQLARVALADPDDRIRQLALHRLTDQALLAKVALDSGSDRTIAVAAVAKVTEQPLLVKVARESPYSETAKAALDRLTDQSQLVTLLQARPARLDTADILPRLTDASTLARVALEAESPAIRQAAVLRLEDQSVVAKVATLETDYGVRNVALGRLTDAARLREVATASPKPENRGAAIVALAARDLEERSAAGGAIAVTWSDIDRAADEGLLARYVLSKAPIADREVALRRITNPALLALIGDRGDRAASVMAMERLEDPDLLLFLGERSGLAPIVRLKLALRDPRVVARHPRLAMRIEHNLDSQGYRLAGRPGISGATGTTVEGEVVAIELREDSQWLARREWRTVFPHQLPVGFAGLPAGPDFIDARIRSEELLSDLLAQREFTQPELTQIFQESPLVELRAGALANLVDQTLLARMVTRGNPPEFRRAALGNLEDQAVLTTIAMDDQESDELRLAAVKNLSDQPLLARLVVHGPFDELRKAAIDNLTDPELLREVARDAAGDLITGERIEDLVQWRVEEMEKHPPRDQKDPD